MNFFHVCHVVGAMYTRFNISFLGEMEWHGNSALHGGKASAGLHCILYIKARIESLGGTYCASRMRGKGDRTMLNLPSG